jgi:hypothetical protein
MSFAAGSRQGTGPDANDHDTLTYDSGQEFDLVPSGCDERTGVGGLQLQLADRVGV